MTLVCDKCSITIPGGRISGMMEVIFVAADNADRVVTKANPGSGRRTLCLECTNRILGWINSSGENQTFYNPVPDNLEYVRGYNPYD